MLRLVPQVNCLPLIPSFLSLSLYLYPWTRVCLFFGGFCFFERKITLKQKTGPEIYYINYGSCGLARAYIISRSHLLFLILNHPPTMLKNNKEMENQLLKALESLAEQSKPNIARTAREFAVPVNRLRHGKEENRFRNDTLMAVSLALY